MSLDKAYGVEKANTAAPNYQVLIGEDGKKFVLDKNGKKMFIKKDANGNEYFVNSQGTPIQKVINNK